MTDLQKYLAEEVAEDHADGIITRREAMRRLGLMGITGAAASTLLTDFAAASQAAATRRGGGGPHDGDEDGRLIAWAPVATEAITYPGPRGTLMAAWAPATRARGGVLVIHENRGLTAHIKSVAGRLAAVGYSALAVDLVSEEGGTEAIGDEAQVAAILSGVSANNPGRLTDDLKASVTELKRRVGRKKLGAVGFCFGGGMVWRLLVAGESRLAAASPFYGPFPEGGDLSRARAAVLGVYGEDDERVNATRASAQAALEDAGLEYQLIEFTGAQHAFFNDTNAMRYNAPAAQEAWRRLVDFYGEHLGRRRRREH
jgi:carboxymethylenebutenolidase